jgi:hypothetical protein
LIRSILSRKTLFHHAKFPVVTRFWVTALPRLPSCAAVRAFRLGLYRDNELLYAGLEISNLRLHSINSRISGIYFHLDSLNISINTVSRRRITPCK